MKSDAAENFKRRCAQAVELQIVAAKKFPEVIILPFPNTKGELEGLDSFKKAMLSLFGKKFVINIEKEIASSK